MKSLNSLKPKFFYERIQLIKELSVRICWMIFYLGAFIFLDDAMKNKEPLYSGIVWIVIMSILSGAIYYFVKNIPLVIISYLLLLSSILFVAAVPMKMSNCMLIVLISMLFFNMMSNVLACKNDHVVRVYSLNVVYIFLPIIYEIYAIYNKDERFYILGFVFGVIIIVGHLWCTYAQEINSFMGGNLNLSGMPRADIYKLNTKIISIIITIFVVISGFMFLLRYTPILMMVGKFIGTPIQAGVGQLVKAKRSLARLMNSSVDIETEQVDTDETPAYEVDETFMNVCGIITCLILLTVVILWLISLFTRKKGPKRKLNIVFSDREDVVEDIVPVKKAKRHLFKDNNEKVRYRFKKWIKKSLKPHVPASKTASELSEIAIRNSFTDIKATSLEDLSEVRVVENEDTIRNEKLASLYDIARYSNRMLTDEELK